LNVLREFVYEQKELKKGVLAKNILSEMQRLMHKLSVNNKHFVTDVKVTILAEGNGMKISLFNADDDEIKKEVFISRRKTTLYL
jgi:DNA sulfur modification protein DndD